MIACDVITVPDFSAKSVAFEARTLFFLASWIDKVGANSKHTLHVACIKEPPQSVRRLAQQAGAIITVFPPSDLVTGSFSNKLRGLEIVPKHDHFLLLDADVVFAAPLQIPENFRNHVMACPGGIPQFSQDWWPRIYAALDMEPPQERIACRFYEFGLPLPKLHYPTQEAEMKAMFPYYNSGVVFGPWTAGLHPVWRHHCQTITQTFSGEPGVTDNVTLYDQTAFATAVEFLKRQNVFFAPLPNEWNATRSGFRRHHLRFHHCKIMHLIGFLRQLKSMKQLNEAMNDFLKERNDILKRDLFLYNKGLTLIRRWWQTTLDRRRFTSFLNRLLMKYVQPSLKNKTS